MIDLPATPALEPIVAKDVESIDDISGGNETILIVDDEVSLAVPLEIGLNYKGYTVLVACNGCEALEIFKKKKREIAVVLTDYEMPKMNGLEVCRQINSLNPDTHKILATGFLEPEIKVEFLKVGVKYFLFKPFDITVVLKIIRQALEKK